MYKKISIFFGFLAWVVLFTSCDSYLDVRPKGITIPERVSEYEELLNYNQQVKMSDVYPAYLTDDVHIPASTDDPIYGGYGAISPYIQRIYSFSSTIFGAGEDDNLWEDSYNRIYTYNVIITHVMEATEGTEAEKKSIRAEALVGRAMEYLVLVNAYAKHYDAATASTDLGIPLMLDDNINQTNLQRATVAAVYAQIQKDLEEAAPSLPQKPKTNAFRASAPVGYGALARMYLYMGDYEQALKNARLSLEKNNTLLDLKLYKVVNNNRAIGRTNIPSETNNPEHIFLRLAPYVYGLSTMRVAGSADLIALFDQSRDQRFLLYYSNALFGMSLNDYRYVPFITSNQAISTPEVYLIAAECEARIGDKDKAMEYINTLRDYRLLNNTALTATDATDALKQVLNERRRELAMVGCHRLFDLKRLNKESAFAKTVTHLVEGAPLTMDPNSPKYILPIPPRVLRYNPDMPDNVR